ncbi:MAG: metallophosphoesterase [Gemmatimonadaceae bacterium]
MRVGLLADTHDRLPVIAALLRRMAERGVTVVIHAGDYCSPFSLAPIVEAQMALAGVFGRNDGDREGLKAKGEQGLGVELFESPHSFEVGGKRILVVHDIGDVAERSIEAHDLVVHGCTHRRDARRVGETLVVNPGEGCGWLYGRPSAAIIDLDTMELETIELDTEEGRD